MLTALLLAAGALVSVPAVGGSPAAALESPTPLPTTSLSLGLSGSRTVVVNTAVEATGQVLAPAGGLLTQLGGVVLSVVQAVLEPLSGVPRAAVALQLKTAGGWSTITTTTTASNGGYRLAVPTYAYGTYTWRLSTSGTATSAGTTSAPFTVGVRAAYTPRGSARSYRLISSSRARWNPCSPVPYYLNPAGMPRGAMGIVQAALAQVQAASGITFRYAGTSRGVPFRSGNSAAGMPAYGFTIAWSTPKTVRRLKGTTVGLSGSWSQSSLTSNAHRYIAGGLVIDRTERLRTSMGRGRTLGFVLMHEIGHLVGLGHTSDRSQVMATTMTARSVTQYGAGDLAGLAAVGLRGGCL